MKKLRVGTRKSPLALQQTEIVIALLKKIDETLSFEIVPLSTKGDREQTADLAKIGGKGVFVKEVEYQLLTQKIDFAVHSLKDMPALLPDGLILAATPKRSNPLDCLILNQAQDLNQPLVIGTSSIRRAKQLAELYPAMTFVPIRGKIETRLRKMRSENLDGTVLACAGLERMNYFDQLPAYQFLSATECVPACGQGILGVEARQADVEVCQLLNQITDPETLLAANAERLFLAQLEGNCELPLGAFAEKNGEQWYFHAYLAESREAKGNQCHLIGSDPLLLAKKALKQLR